MAQKCSGIPHPLPYRPRAPALPAGPRATVLALPSLPMVTGAGASLLPLAAHSSGPPPAGRRPPPDVAAPSQSAQRLSLTLGPRSCRLPPQPPSACTVHTVPGRAGLRVRFPCGSLDSLNVPDPQDWLCCDWFSSRISQSLPSGIM